MSTILPHVVCGLSANLEWMWHTRLAENTGRKNHAKNGHLCSNSIAPLCGPMSLQLSHVSTIGKKLVKQQYLPHMSSTVWWTLAF